MFGAVVGDILGSVHEKIPGFPLRKNTQMTDDSFLTFASFDWVQNIDYEKFNYYFNYYLNNKEDVLWLNFQEELSEQAIYYLIKWHKIGHDFNVDLDKSIPVFSPGFESWIKSKTFKIESHVKHKGNTNGCLMRNSSIPYFGVNNNLSLVKILKLSEIFCLLTHYSPESLNAVRLHSLLLYYVYHHIVIKQNIKQCLISDIFSLSKINENLLFSNINIQPLKFWINHESKFIWDAKTSLDIALSAIYFSNSFQETINFCCNTKMDADTYSAIAGPIASTLWGIEIENINIGLENIKPCSEAYNLIKNNLIIDFKIL